LRTRGGAANLGLFWKFSAKLSGSVPNNHNLNLEEELAKLLNNTMASHIVLGSLELGCGNKLVHSGQ
jgi:hypothetical protein